MAFEIPKLDYAYDALEPHVDARTMEIHHSKHHAGYATNLNNAIAGTDLDGKSIEDILADLSSAPGDKKGAINFNGGGFDNHCIYWSNMSPNGGGEPSGALADAIGDDVVHHGVDRTAAIVEALDRDETPQRTRAIEGFVVEAGGQVKQCALATVGRKLDFLQMIREAKLRVGGPCRCRQSSEAGHDSFTQPGHEHDGRSERAT